MEIENPKTEQKIGIGIGKRILLTGASGTIGYEVLKQLHQKGYAYDITVFDVKSSKSLKKFKPFRKRVKIVYGDITRESDLELVTSDKDAVIHLAAIIPPAADEKPKLTHRVNALGTEKLIRLLEENSPKAFFIYSSSISVYGDRLIDPWISVGDALNPSVGDEYAKTKIEAEKSVQNSKLDWTIFRLTAVMGGHKLSKFMFHQPLNTSLEIATPQDTARALVNAIEKREPLNKKIFNLGGGEECRISFEHFLSREFEIYGLGKLNFPPKTFAEKNFHCGNYKDGDVLENILNFRQDTLETFFEHEKSKVSPFIRFIVSILKNPIKKYLEKQSEPLAAYYDQDEELIRHYFHSDGRD